ncbi:hypothetical protein FRC14_004839 [Serendipita sp. 396]|nr:hypothetical protein FRC14_004839 [Serendipita sp. 396]KAG8777337.1 hypothetical protein FRC16_004215 [Serendipita sp. 398]KAG8842547.1 hypothetical protein FRC20_004357 [Serendipita sp. 405]
MSGPKVAIVIYSMYGHIAKMAESVKKGIEEAGGTATILQVPETLPTEVLEKMHAPPKPEYPVIAPADLLDYDAYVFGISTRYGGWSAQFKSFWDASGQLWAAGALAGRLAGAFVSTGGPGGGQESTYFSILSTLVHHGLVFVPLGYKHTNALWNQNFNEVHGGSPFGAGTFAGDGTRQPSELESTVASIQGREFYNIVNKHTPVVAATPAPATTEKKQEVSTTSAAHEKEKTTTSTTVADTPSKPNRRKSVMAKIIHQLKQ